MGVAAKGQGIGSPAIATIRTYPQDNMPHIPKTLIEQKLMSLEETNALTRKNLLYLNSKLDISIRRRLSCLPRCSISSKTMPLLAFKTVEGGNIHDGQDDHATKIGKVQVIYSTNSDIQLYIY